MKNISKILSVVLIGSLFLVGCSKEEPPAVDEVKEEVKSESDVIDPEEVKEESTEEVKEEPVKKTNTSTVKSNKEVPASASNNKVTKPAETPKKETPKEESKPTPPPTPPVVEEVKPTPENQDQFPQGNGGNEAGEGTNNPPPSDIDYSTYDHDHVLNGYCNGCEIRKD